jgi:HEAT repeat protein
MRTPTLAALVCAACASAGRAPAPRPPAEQQARLVQAEKLYRSNADGFAAERDALARDPVTALWLARLFVRDLLWARDRRQANDAVFLQAVAGRDVHPVEARALEQLRAMGGAAAPAVIEDLFDSQYTDRQEIGAEVLAAIGPAVLPALEPRLASGDRRQRTRAVRALAAMEKTPPVVAALERAAGDGEFTVRAAACPGLAACGAAGAQRLRTMLARDADPFVRRTAAAELGAFADVATATALVEYLERCVDAGDGRGREAADAALRRIAGGAPRSGTPGWRAWLVRYSKEGR